MNNKEEELKKGCGDSCYYSKIEHNWIKCGEELNSGLLVLCPSCKAKLSGIQLAKQEVLKIIDEVFKNKKWLWIGEDDEINLEKSVIEFKEELKSKIEERK